MRQASILRKTNEVDIRGRFCLDGSGTASLATGIEPLNHLLTLWAFHGLFDLTITAEGDLQHHILEDVGIALGKAVKQSLGEKEGISRYGCFTAVMDKVAVEVAVDISGRPSLHGVENINLQTGAKGTFDNTDFTFINATEFLEAFLQHAGVSLVYTVKSGEGDLHHILEALFKAFGKALEQASRIEPRRKGVPSTKGIID